MIHHYAIGDCLFEFIRLHIWSVCYKTVLSALEYRNVLAILGYLFIFTPTLLETLTAD